MRNGSKRIFYAWLNAFFLPVLLITDIVFMVFNFGKCNAEF
jgi:hypothetical protein